MQTIHNNITVLKKQQQLIEFQIQDEKIQTDESPSLTTESIVEQDNEQTKEPTEEIIQKLCSNKII